MNTGTSYSRMGAAKHPAMIFTIIAGVCLASTLFIPPSGPVPRSTGHISETDIAQAAGKVRRIAPTSAVDLACKGQSWGDESSECLAAILNHSGRVRPVRIIENTGSQPDAY
ncbi:hypothetical protein [Sinorhizobium psoraleae]|uniref:Uncharacterized protein n=1 Tax=Sinorhizobium psoraleae TaxID=520838 RepID=A0ABT4KBG8_9HYPH|nr:hypothetical protein [Sinorhizobium psoraleae]MCZ4089189.1 hypothetical protein [Sinorhizobium psoraleae]